MLSQSGYGHVEPTWHGIYIPSFTLSDMGDIKAELLDIMKRNHEVLHVQRDAQRTTQAMVAKAVASVGPEVAERIGPLVHKSRLLNEQFDLLSGRLLRLENQRVPAASRCRASP